MSSNFPAHTLCLTTKDGLTIKVWEINGKARFLEQFSCDYTCPYRIAESFLINRCRLLDYEKIDIDLTCPIVLKDEKLLGELLLREL
jgi:hypothetical protein